MSYRPSDDDFEVVEEVIEDFDYFYEVEDEIIRNAKLKRKLCFFSIGIITSVLLLVILFTGMIQMRIYGVDDTYVSKEIITEIDYKRNIEDAYIYARDFYSEKEVGNKIQKSGILSEIENFINGNEQIMLEDLEDKYLLEILETCSYYIGDIDDDNDGFLEKIEIPESENDEYQHFNDMLINTFVSINSICSEIQRTGKMPEYVTGYTNNRYALNAAYNTIYN